MRLVLDDRPAELLALLGVVERVLVRGARDADRLRADERTGRLERRSSRPAPALLLPSRARARRSSSFSLPPSRQRAGDAHVVEDDLGGVAGADAVLLELLAHASDPGVPGGTTKLAWPRAFELGVDRRDDHVDVGDAAVGDPRLGAVEHPLVLGLVVDRAGAQRADVACRRRARSRRTRPSWIVVGRAEALRDPLADLLGRAVGDDAGRRRGWCRRWRGAMPASPQHSSSLTIGNVEAGRVAERVGA